MFFILITVNILLSNNKNKLKRNKGAIIFRKPEEKMMCARDSHILGSIMVFSMLFLGRENDVY